MLIESKNGGAAFYCGDWHGSKMVMLPSTAAIGTGPKMVAPPSTAAIRTHTDRVPANLKPQSLDSLRENGGHDRTCAQLATWLAWTEFLHAKSGRHEEGVLPECTPNHQHDTR
jgi:hypothetical protein